MLDRVREALFSMLAPWLAGGEGEGSAGVRVLDLFAGSGSLAFEALSRGATMARLVEADAAVLAVAAANARALGVDDRVELLIGDALSPGSWGSLDWSVDPPCPLGDPPAPWDLVLCDPPFPLVRALATRAGVLGAAKTLARAFLAPDGILVLHVPAGEVREDELGGAAVARRTYGTNALWFLQGEVIASDAAPAAGGGAGR